MNRRLYICILAAAAVVSSSCVREHEEQPPVVPETGIVNAQMSFVIPFDGDEDPYVGARKTRGPGTVVDDDVLDVLIMQFDGVLPTSKLVARPQYFPDVTQAGQISLLGSEGKTHRIVAIGNTGSYDFEVDMEPWVTTYADAERLSRRTDSEKSGCFADRVMVAGTTDAVITNGVQLSFDMIRAFAKLEFTISNNAIASDIELKTFQLCNVARKADVFGGYMPHTEITPTLDSDLLDFNVYDLALSPGESHTFTWFLPPNQQGVAELISGDTKDKNTYAPDNAMFFRIIGEYTDAESNAPAKVIYTIYPGADMVSDFNICANKRYTMSIQIDSESDPKVDTRVEHYKLIDLKNKPANSYILNPPSEHAGVPRRYRIYPWHVNRYWGGGSWNNNDQPYEILGNAHIGSKIHGGARPWAVEVIWQIPSTVVRENNTTPSYTTTTRLYINPNASGEEDYFEIEVPVNAVGGNFTVGLFHNDDGNGIKDVNEPYRWSWHFWVTDYDPDAKVNFVQNGIVSESRYIYPVPGGAVHRYDGEQWTDPSGKFHRAVIMDRHLGWNTLPSTYSSTYYLLYQYGRKDPFPYGTRYNKIGSSTVAPKEKTEQGGLGTDIDISDSIAFPDTFFTTRETTTYGADWTGVEEIGQFMLWKDKYISGKTVDDFNALTEKSIFDPCPYGWQVPSPNAFEDFESLRTVQNSSRTSLAYSSGIRYYPGTNSDPVRGEIYYPRTYHLNNSAGTVTTNAVLILTSSPANGHYTNTLYFDSGTWSNHNYAYGRGRGLPVRCIKLSIDD